MVFSGKTVPTQLPLTTLDFSGTFDHMRQSSSAYRVCSFVMEVDPLSSLKVQCMKSYQLYWACMSANTSRLSCLSNRLHSGRSGRSFSRSNSRNRSTSRAPLHHRTTPSDQQGGSSGRQLMNVALPNGQRPTQTKAKAKGDTQGRPAAPIKTKELHKGESESQRLRALCALPAPRADRVGEVVLI